MRKGWSQLVELAPVIHPEFLTSERPTEASLLDAPSEVQSRQKSLDLLEYLAPLGSVPVATLAKSGRIGLPNSSKLTERIRSDPRCHKCARLTATVWPQTSYTGAESSVMPVRDEASYLELEMTGNHSRPVSANPAASALSWQNSRAPSSPPVTPL